MLFSRVLQSQYGRALSSPWATYLLSKSESLDFTGVTVSAVKLGRPNTGTVPFRRQTTTRTHRHKDCADIVMVFHGLFRKEQRKSNLSCLLLAVRAFRMTLWCCARFLDCLDVSLGKVRFMNCCAWTSAAGIGLWYLKIYSCLKRIQNKA